MPPKEPDEQYSNIVASLKSLRDGQGDLRSEMRTAKAQVQEVKTDVIVLRERSDHITENCPMRVEIARATNGATRAHKAADAAHTTATTAIERTVENRVSIAKLAAVAGMGGGLGGIVGAVLSHTLKLCP